MDKNITWAIAEAIIYQTVTPASVNLGLGLKKWSLIIHHSIFVTHHSSLITHHSSLIT